MTEQFTIDRPFTITCADGATLTMTLHEDELACIGLSDGIKEVLGILDLDQRLALGRALLSGYSKHVFEVGDRVTDAIGIGRVIANLDSPRFSTVVEWQCGITAAEDPANLKLAVSPRT